MKKGRYGYLFSALVEYENLLNIEKAFFKETPTIGIRKKEVFRTELKRESIVFHSSLGDINVKKSFYNNELINLKPEYEDIIKICKKYNKSIKEVLNIFYREFKEI